MENPHFAGFFMGLIDKRQDSSDKAQYGPKILLQFPNF